MSLAVMALALSVLAACGGGGDSQNARAEIKVMLPQGLAAGDVTRVHVEVRGPSIPTPIGIDLTQQGGTWQGTVVDIPAGVERLFEATAFDAGGVLLYRGHAGSIAIPAGGTVSVAIQLQQVNPPPVYENVPPTIDSVVVSSNHVSPGGTLRLTATAHDDNPGDTLTYAWTANAGVFTSPNEAATSWVAPSTEGVQVLRLEVTDPKGTKATLTLDVSVQQSGALGSATVTVGFNTWPSITSMTVSPSVLTLGNPSQLAVGVSDADGDVLSFLWTSDCVGAFSDVFGATPTFTAVAPPQFGNRCSVSVSVSDGRGGQNMGILTLLVGTAPRANVAPQVDSTFKSAEEVEAWQSVTVGLAAHDPEETPLTFSWTASQGTLLATRQTPTSSEVDWRAPDCLEGPVVFTAIVTDGEGATTTQLFSIPPSPGSECGGPRVSGIRLAHFVRADEGVMVSPVDLSTASIGAWVPSPDGQNYSWRPGFGQPNGSFLIPNVASTPYLLKFNNTYVWSSSRALDLSYTELGRFDVEAEPAGTQLSVNLSGLSPWQELDDIQLSAPNAGIGFFSGLQCIPGFLPPDPGSTTFSLTFDYMGPLQACGSFPARISPSHGDILYANQLVSRTDVATGLTVQELHKSFQTHTLESSGAGTLQLSGELQSLPITTETVDYRASAFEALALASHPTAQPAYSFLNIGTLPGYSAFGSVEGWPDLVFADRGAGLGDFVASFSYGSPFPSGWTRFITAQSNAYVRYSVELPGGGTSTPTTVRVYTYVQEPMTSGTPSTLVPRMGPPRDLRINGLGATGNLTAVGLTPMVSWTPPSLGTADRYSVRVYELQASGSGSTTRTLRATFLTNQIQLRLPPGVLGNGKSYYVQVTSTFQPGMELDRPYLGKPVLHEAMAVTGRFQP